MTLENLKRIAAARTKEKWEYVETADNEQYLCDECGTEQDLGGYAVISKDEHQVLDCRLYGMQRFAQPNAQFIATAANTYDALLELAQCFASVASEEDMRENLCCYVQGVRALEILDKLTSDGEG